MWWAELQANDGSSICTMAAVRYVGCNSRGSVATEAAIISLLVDPSWSWWFIAASFIFIGPDMNMIAIQNYQGYQILDFNSHFSTGLIARSFQLRFRLFLWASDRRARRCFYNVDFVFIRFVWSRAFQRWYQIWIWSSRTGFSLPLKIGSSKTLSTAVSQGDDLEKDGRKASLVRPFDRRDRELHFGSLFKPIWPLEAELWYVMVSYCHGWNLLE